MDPSQRAFSYDAFITYSRHDASFARKLESALENYRPPRGLDLPPRNLNIFRDEGDMTGTEYYRSIGEHLSNSAKLIVVCSPAARRSEYVTDEIRRFLSNRDAMHVISTLVSGAPNNVPGVVEEDKAFPDALCDAMQLPLAIDFRNFNPGKDRVTRGVFESGWLTLLANIYNISRSNLEQREKNRQRRRVNTAIAAASIVILSLAVLSVIALYQRGVALDQRNAALRTQSLFLAKQARDQIGIGRTDLGIKLALEALPMDLDHPDRPLVPSAEMALFTAVARQRFRTVFDGSRGDLDRVLLSPDGTRLVTLHGGIIGDLRIWEASTGELLVTHKKPGFYISNADISADSKYLVVGFSLLQKTYTYAGATVPNQVHLYDLTTGDMADRFGLEGYKATFVKFGNSSSEVIVAGDEGLMLFEVLPRMQRKTAKPEDEGYFKTENGYARLIISTPDGGDPIYILYSRQNKTVGVVQYSGLAVLIDLSGRLAARFIRVPLDRDKIERLRISDDGTFVLAFARSKRLFLVDAISGVVLSEISVPNAKSIIDAQFKHGSARFRTISPNGAVYEWDPTTQLLALRQDPPGMTKAVENVLCNSDCSTAVVGLASGGIELWSLVDRTNTPFLDDKAIKLVDADFNEPLHTVAVAASDNIARTMDLKTSRARIDLNHKSEAIAFAELANSGGYIVLGYKDGSMELREPRTQKLLWSIEHAHEQGITHVAFSANDARVVSASEDGRAKVWDTRTGQALRNLVGHRQEVSFATFSPDGRYVLTCSRDSTSRLWDTATGSLVHELPVPKEYLDPIYNASMHHHGVFTKDGRYAVTASAGDYFMIGQPALIWDVEAGKLMHALSHNGAAIWSVSITPDDRYVITTSYDQSAALWDIGTGKKVWTLSGHSWTVTNALLLPSTGRVVTSSNDTTARIWDLHTGATLHVLKGHTKGILSLAIDSTGRVIATGAGDGSVRLWDAREGNFVVEFANGQAPITHLQFAHGGEALLALSSDGAARLYKLPAFGQRLIDYGRATYTKESDGYLTKEQRRRFALEE